MFKTFINAFKVKDVRRKIFYVLMMLVVIRLGSQMPVPGVMHSRAAVSTVSPSLL